MNPLYIVVICGAIASISFSLLKGRSRKRDNDSQNIEEETEEKSRLETICEPGETVKILCRGAHKDEYYAMTESRLIIDGKEGVQSIPFSSVEKVKFEKMGGDKARNAQDCYSFTVKADKKYKFFYNSGKFEDLCAEMFYRYGG